MLRREIPLAKSRQIHNPAINIFVSYLKLLLFSIFFFGVNIQIIFAQSLFSDDSIYYENPSLNMIEYGVDKIVNTYTFKGNADLFLGYGWGNISLKQNYLGRAITSGNRSFWDDELLNFGVDIKVKENLFFKITQNISYFSSDIKTQALSKINQSRSSGGLKYYVLKNLYIETNSGYEINEQGLNKGSGSILNFRSTLSNYNLEDYFLNGTALAEYISLNDGREKSLMDLRGNLSRNFDESNSLRIDVRYKTFLYPVALSDVGEGSIKYRLEDNLYSNLFFSFGLSENIFGSIGIIAENKDVAHSYNKFFDGYKNTAIETNRDELNLNFSGELSYQKQNFFQSFGMSYLSRNENNNAVKKFDINDVEFNVLKKQEQILDNISSMTQMKTRTLYLFPNRDSLVSHIFLSLYRYDTPSEEINDDRDEFTSLMNVRYSHIFSENLSASLEAEVQMIHYVYIKSQRSANNHWYRSFKLSPSVKITTDLLSMNPWFYVSANYYAYDFEDLSPNVDSYSIREIGYRDSLCLKLTNKMDLQCKFKIRYYEQGILFWDSFAETPQSSNYEHFIQVLSFYHPYENLSLGCGVRFFELNQKNLGIYALTNRGLEHFSFAPESVISYKLNEDIAIDIRSWYEFQRTGRELEYKEIPNLLMVTRISI